MSAQWDLINRTVVSGSASTVTFSSIGSYQAYRVVATTLDGAGSDYLALRLNGSTSNVNSVGYFSNSGASAVVANGFGYMSVGINAGNSGSGTANSVACNILDIGFANSTSRPKPIVGLGGWARNMLRASGASWNDTSALTSISLGVGSPFGNFQVNTVVALYGRNIA